MSRFIRLVVVFLLPTFVVVAQSTGKIVGKVTDKNNGDALIGVTVVIPGTNNGAVTDVEGRYQLKVTPGTYTVDFKYIGYSTKSITGVVVSNGGAATLDLIMDEPSSKALKEVVITGSYKQESINALYVAQKNNAVVSDGISAEAIRRSPDRNTGEVLKRVSGTSIQDNKFVVVRGLGDRYNSTLMNSAILPSTEPDKKAFSFDIIPSNLIDNITIYKTASPDLPGDFAGGAVKVNTKDFPDQKFLEVQVGTAYNTETTGKKFTKGAPDGKYDFLGWDDGARALPASYAAANKGYTDLSVEQKIVITKDFSNTYGTGTTDESKPSLGLQLAMGNSFKLSRGRKFGYIFSVNYNSSRRASMRSRDEYQPGVQKFHFFGFDDQVNVRQYNAGSVLNFAYTYGRSKIAWKNFFSNSFYTDFTVRNGAYYESGVQQVQSYNNESTQNGLINSVLEGQHALKNDKLQIAWNLSYGYSYRSQPDQRILAFVRDDPKTQPTGDTVFHIKIPVENSPAIRNAGRVFSGLYENILGAGVNLTAPFQLFNEEQKFKFGGMVTHRNRNFSALAMGYATSGIYGEQIALDGKTTPGNLFSNASIDEHQLFLAKIDLNSKDYQGLATLAAGYLMLDNKFSDHWRLAWGARIESYTQELKSLNQAQNKHDNTDVLPSANLTYALGAKSNIRASYFKSVNRPEFRELANFSFYDYDNEYNIFGNASLKRATISNADLRYEFFQGVGEIMSASVFYKQFKDPIEQINEGNNVLTYSNATKATDYGAEIELRKRLDFISSGKFFKNLVFYTNASWINSKVTLDTLKKKTPLQGQSPYLVNAGLSYATADNDFAVNLLYNRIGQRLRFRGKQGGGLDTYEKPRDLLDFQVTKKVLHKKGEIKLNISDILSQPIAWYYKFGDGGTGYKKGTDEIINSYKPGTTFSLAFRYSF